MTKTPNRRFFVIRILARPRPKTFEFERFGGAHVNCWIDAPTEEAAASRADAEVRQAGWIPETIESSVEVTRDSYLEQDEGREYFEQALTDGVVVVVHTFPLEASEIGAH